MENVNSLHIVTYNVKGIQKYFKNEIGKNGVLFLQDRHLTTTNEGKWKDKIQWTCFLFTWYF